MTATAETTWRVRQHLVEAGRLDLAARVVANHGLRPVIPWADGTPPADVEEVRVVAAAFAAAYDDEDGWDEQWVEDQWRVWSGTTESWWWLSFVDEDTEGPDAFLGACYVRATNGPLAVSRAYELGINPGGQVAIMGPGDEPPEGVPTEKLLTRADLQELGGFFTMRGDPA